MLDGQKILLGVSGGIAIYKSCELVRRLKDAGSDIRVVMTAGAEAFITPLTFQALSGNPVHSQLLDSEAEAGMGHIELARWADRVVIAPATANLIARLAEGRADDLLSTLCLATKAPIALAPSMNQAMWSNAATQNNIARLEQYGLEMIGPDAGDQACGDIGPGRMSEPAKIIEALNQHPHPCLAGKKVLITAGPTREAIDPVRYVSNYSSGKMGYALASAFAKAGAETTLVSGPVSLPCPFGVSRISVTSCAEMHAEVMARAQDSDIFIASAAVADYRPEQRASEKIKKKTERMEIQLVKNPDILAQVAALEKRPYVAGFAAESNNLIEHATQKLLNKKLDLIIANDISDTSIGFQSDNNAVSLLTQSKAGIEQTDIRCSAKRLVAIRILQFIAEKISV